MNMYFSYLFIVITYLFTIIIYAFFSLFIILIYFVLLI